MPLFADGLRKIRNNLLQIQAGEKPKMVRIGTFTGIQLTYINEQRGDQGLEPVVGGIVFVGRHLYKSRCQDDGYSIDEVIEQIQSAFSEKSIVGCERGTVLINAEGRTNKDGRCIRDEAVFECTQKHPNPELWSVIPKGDGKYRKK